MKRGSGGWAVRGGERDKTLTYWLLVVARRRAASNGACLQSAWVLRRNRGLGLDLMRYNAQIPLAIPIFIIRNMACTFFNITHENDFQDLLSFRDQGKSGGKLTEGPFDKSS